MVGIKVVKSGVVDIDKDYKVLVGQQGMVGSLGCWLYS